MLRILPPFIAAMFLSFALAVPLAQGQQPASASFHLVKIEFTGLERLRPERLISLSGLTVGQTVDEPALDRAANILAKSGLFKAVSYSVRGSREQAVLIFAVIEGPAPLPVIFDNFVWFTDDELLEGVQRVVPGFAGTSPATGEMAEGIKRALTGLLQDKKIAGTVTFATVTDPENKMSTLVYSVSGAGMKVCSISFPGASVIPEKSLQKTLSELIGKPYSKTSMVKLAHEQVVPLYRTRGMLQARFGIPQPQLSSSEACRDGVTVEIPITEGVAYTWSTVQWTGNTIVPEAELTHAVDLRAGDIADGVKFDAGLAEARKHYSKLGYIDAKLEPAADFDAAKRTVAYRIKVVEGAQFRMGSFDVVGLPDRLLRSLKAKWKLPTGEIYDGTYLNDFVIRVIHFDADVMNVTRRNDLNRINESAVPDREKHTVDVTISFEHMPKEK